MTHFQQLSLKVSQFILTAYGSFAISGGHDLTVSIRFVAKACQQQKCCKAAGLYVVGMEAFIYGGQMLHIHAHSI